MRKARITCHTGQRLGAIDPFIYGHFIEHLAECIYGGMWAEMLRNHKFAGHDQPSEGEDRAAQYGIPAPWRAVNRTASVRFLHDNTITYNGVQAQRIDLREADGAPHGVGQPGITLEAGRSYDVRLVLSGKDLAGPVTVALVQGETVYASKTVDVGDGWDTHAFSLTAAADDADAEFRVTIDRPGRLWIGAASLMPADNVNGWRRDVLELIRGIKPPIIRYPGGNFVSGYHWEDGIGDRDRRPIRYDYAWNVWEPNDVGIDEFMTLCKELDTEPYISVNAGNGTAAEAAAWVEYCNGAANTRYGAMRAANGHPEPYGIRYWGIGNEMYGNWQIGHCDAETFARRHVAFAHALRSVDASIVLLGVGDMPDQPGYWLETVTEIAGADVDLMTVHHYTDVPSDIDEATRDALVTACPEHIGRLLDDTRRVLDAYGPEGHRIAISFDEWNVAHRGVGRRQNYALRDGLYAAGMFNAFQARCDSVTMANIAQLVNLLGVIETGPTAAYGTPIYYAFKLYGEHCGDAALAAEVDCDTFDLPAVANIPALEGVPYLSVSATLDATRGVACLAVANRHASDDITAEIALDGVADGAPGRAWELNGPGMDARNTFDAPNRVAIREVGEVTAGPRFSYTFPAHSVTALEIPLVS